jgi:hypothetical protein
MKLGDQAREFKRKKGFEWWTEFNAVAFARVIAREESERNCAAICEWCRRDYQVEFVDGRWIHSLGPHDCRAAAIRSLEDEL